ncbi:MAG: hypothetical protein WBG42_09410 [Cryomorphaceae bacterium]
MAEKDLTDAQVSLIIDFLKRWGIDSPELVFELTDHYCEKAKEKMEQGGSFEKVLDSWKTKKHMIELRQIQSDFEVIVKKKWWKAHLQAVKKLFLTRQLFLFIGVLALMFLSYRFELGSAFSILAILSALLAFCVLVYLYHFKRFKLFFETRDLTVPVMGTWFIIWEFISEGGEKAFYANDSFEFSLITLTISIISGFIGYNLLSTAHHELKMITSEYISEPNKYQVR